jgi:hypothetical protein
MVCVTTAPAPATFCLQDAITGKYRHLGCTYAEAKAHADADAFLTIRRMDEVKLGWT